MTTLQGVRQTKRHFGFVVAIHEMAEYAIVESERNGTTMFSPFIAGVALGYSADTLDAALVTAIAAKYDGRNTQAGHFFLRMIGADE